MEDDVSCVRGELANFLASPLNPQSYPTQREPATWDARKKKFEAVVQQKSAELRSLKEKLGDLRGTLLRAQQAFDQAAFAERMSRLPAPEKSHGTFSMVG